MSTATSVVLTVAAVLGAIGLLGYALDATFGRRPYPAAAAFVGFLGALHLLWDLA